MLNYRPEYSTMQRKWIFLSILVIAVLNILYLRNAPNETIVVTIFYNISVPQNLSAMDGCIFPILDPWHESILDLIEKDGSIDCNQTAESGKKIFKMFNVHQASQTLST